MRLGKGKTEREVVKYVVYQPISGSTKGMIGGTAPTGVFCMVELLVHTIIERNWQVPRSCLRFDTSASHRPQRTILVRENSARISGSSFLILCLKLKFECYIFFVSNSIKVEKTEVLFIGTPH